MGFFNKYGKKLHKFGEKLQSGIHTVAKFGGKMENFVEKKALPVAGAIAKGLDVGLKIATPVIGAVAPELLPAVVGGEMLVKGIRKGIDTGQKGLKLGKQLKKTKESLEAGKFKQSIDNLRETKKQGEAFYKDTKEKGEQLTQVKNPFKK
jgi:hypothetical protein